MALDLTFKQVCDLIKKNGKEDPKLIEAIDKLLGLALICSPVVLGPDAVVLLSLLTAKNEIVKIGKAVFEKLTKKKDEDYLGRQERMQVAYGLLVFTAFFEALDSQMPKPLRDKIGLIEPEKAFLARDASRKAAQQPKGLADMCERADSPFAAIQSSFPHPTESLAQQTARHASLWKQMGLGFGEFIQKLAVWEQADEKEQTLMLSWVQTVPEEARSVFEAQYFELARRFEDFAVWANLQEHKKTKELIGELSEYVRQHALLSNAGKTSIDIGFAKLHEAVLRIPETLKISQATEIVNSLALAYTGNINEPVIEEKEEPQRQATPLLPAHL